MKTMATIATQWSFLYTTADGQQKLSGPTDFGNWGVCESHALSYQGAQVRENVISAHALGRVTKVRVDQ